MRDVKEWVELLEYQKRALEEKEIKMQKGICPIGKEGEEENEIDCFKMVEG